MLFRSPVPFDWKVRSSFALGNIPSLFDSDSVFGLAVLRFLKIIYNECKNKLDDIEYKAVGDWYNEVVEKLQKLELEKKQIEVKAIFLKRRAYQRQMYLISFVVAIISIMIAISSFFAIKYITTIIGGILGISISVLLPLITNRKLSQDAKMDKSKEYLNNIENEIEQFRTLINTDDRLKEYLKKEKIRHTTIRQTQQ